jgi:hypothetical protein
MRRQHSNAQGLLRQKLLGCAAIDPLIQLRREESFMSDLIWLSEAQMRRIEPGTASEMKLLLCQVELVPALLRGCPIELNALFVGKV